ncbi:MAG: hypothetical protein N2490_01040 [Ignavibacteria bacterium]|nr:hypothetical protein [Ignavibacteria bacterium]
MIPNIFHFIYFYPDKVRENEFNLTHYLCIKSAHDLNRPAKMYLHTNREPQMSPWWERIKEKLELNIIKPPEKVFDRELRHPAHKSDVARIYILKEIGGIYLDLDIICKKPFSPLMNYKFVMGKEGFIKTNGLCNGVIFSEKNAEFLNLWLEEFRYFRSTGFDKYWAEISVKRSYKLAKKHPDLIHIEPYYSFHYPLYYSRDLKKLFEKNIDYKKAYCHHLWENASKEKYLSKLTPEIIKTVDTTFNVIARKFL